MPWTYAGSPAPAVPAVGPFASASSACLFQSSTAVAGESAAAGCTPPPRTDVAKAAASTKQAISELRLLQRGFILVSIFTPLLRYGLDVRSREQTRPDRPQLPTEAAVFSARF